jgi:hypothetical protein
MLRLMYTEIWVREDGTVVVHPPGSIAVIWAVDVRGGRELWLGLVPEEAEQGERHGVQLYIRRVCGGKSLRNAGPRGRVGQI